MNDTPKLKLEKTKTCKILTELIGVLPNGDLAISELEKLTKINYTTIYRYLAVLVAAGYVRESRIVALASFYVITKKGEEYLKKLEIKEKKENHGNQK